jgi:hypothetical protein
VHVAVDLNGEPGLRARIGRREGQSVSPNRKSSMKRPIGCCRRILKPILRLRTASHTFASGGVSGWRKSRDRWSRAGETEWPLGLEVMGCAMDSPSPRPSPSGRGSVPALSRREAQRAASRRAGGAPRFARCAPRRAISLPHLLHRVADDAGAGCLQESSLGRTKLGSHSG